MTNHRCWLALILLASGTGCESQPGPPREVPVSTTQEVPTGAVDPAAVSQPPRNIATH